MGLLYQLPVKHDPLDDRIFFKDDCLTIKSYGLPYIFWAYFLGICVVVFFMYLAIKDPIEKIYQSSDVLNQYLAHSVLATFIFIPSFLLFFFFYEKVLVRSKNRLEICHRVFGLTLRKVNVAFKSNDQLILQHHLDSPNVAKIRAQEEFKGFENKGYHELYIQDLENPRKQFLIDRNSRLGELKKLQKLLSLDS